MSFELNAEVNLDVEVEIEVPDVEIEVEIDVPEVEVEIEVEAPQVEFEVEIEAPQVEFEVEVEAPQLEVEIELDAGAQLNAPIVDIEVGGGDVEVVTVTRGPVNWCCWVVWYAVMIAAFTTCLVVFALLWGNHWYYYTIFGVLDLVAAFLLCWALVRMCKGKSSGSEGGVYVAEVEVGGNAGFEVEMNAPVVEFEVEVEAPQVEFEVEIEAPQVEFEVEIEAPQVEFEVEIEVPDVEVEVEVDAGLEVEVEIEM